MNWKYDKNFKQWWNDDWLIQKNHLGKYGLYFDPNDEDYFNSRRRIGDFKKLSSAKQVAELIEEG